VHAGVAPIFLGIVVGLVVGSIPIPVPGIPTPLRLGLAGGPLLVALVLGRIGQIGPINWALPSATNRTIREIGIALFLAVVGLNAGGRFVETLSTDDGWRWMAAGAVITLVPPAIIIAVARLWLKENYLSICGLASGAMTDPPALAFAIQAGGSSAPALVFASVYATAMFLRILCAQLLIVLFAT
jgi:putative transport protein